MKYSFNLADIAWCMLMLLTVNCQAQDTRFSMPIGGTEGKDYWIGCYVDHNEGSGIADQMCGSKTYDGHKGTDFFIRSFKTMDSGVAVRAIANGVVLEVRDGLFDRNTEWIGGGYGNFISIIHEGGYVTYYGHLKKNSLTVKQGDKVWAGMVIGLVGSSGYSDWPHLHLEIKRNGKIVNPFVGNCNDEKSSLWASVPPYDTSLYVIDHGFVPFIPNYNDLMERYMVRDTCRIGRTAKLCFWLQVHGVRKGDQTTVKWYTPENSLWYSYDYVWDVSTWISYTWFYIKVPRESGAWAVEYYVNSKMVAKDTVYLAR